GYEGVDPPQRQGPERACYDDKDNEQHQHDAKREPPLSDAGRQVGEHKLMRHARDLRRLLPARAANGHTTAAPPRSDMNSRLFTRSPRRRAAGTAPGSSARAPSQS